MSHGYNKTLVVECTCGGSFFCTEKELKASLSSVRECGALFSKDGENKRCNLKYSYIRLLKIMQITSQWNAADTYTESRAENIEIETF